MREKNVPNYVRFRKCGERMSLTTLYILFNETNDESCRMLKAIDKHWIHINLNILRPGGGGYDLHLVRAHAEGKEMIQQEKLRLERRNVI